MNMQRYNTAFISKDGRSFSLSLLQELQCYVCRQREQEAGVQGAEVRLPMVLRYPLPYPQDPSPPPLVPQRPAELQYGNPYSTDTTRGERNRSSMLSVALHLPFLGNCSHVLLGFFLLL